MGANFKTLLHSNTLLTVEDKTQLLKKYDHILEADDVFTRPDINPSDIADILRKYGWFWVSIEKDPKNNNGVSDLVVADISNIADTAKAEVQYYDTRLGEMQTSNFTDFVNRIKQGNPAEVLENVMVRLMRSPFEGAEQVQFPADPGNKLVFPSEEQGIRKIQRLYKDFLYYSDKKSFAAYLYSYLQGITDMSIEKKAKLFNEHIYSFNTRQWSLKLYENCVFSTRTTVLKLMGLLPMEFEVLNFEMVNGVFTAPYPEKMVQQLQAELNLKTREFCTIMGLTGINDLEQEIYVNRFGYTGNSAEGRQEAALQYLNGKIIPFFAGHSPKKTNQPVFKKNKLNKDDANDLHAVLLKMGDPTSLMPVILHVTHSSRLDHYIALVYNPFMDALVVLDPLVIGDVNDGVLEEEISNIPVITSNDLYTWEWLDWRYPAFHELYYTFE